MPTVLLLTDDPAPECVLPSLSLLDHAVSSAPIAASALVDADGAQVVIVDARHSLPAGRAMCRLLSTGTAVPVVAVVTDGGLVAVNAEWGVDDIVLPSTGPAEIDVRLRLLVDRRGAVPGTQSVTISLGDLVIDEDTYTARLRGKPLELTYKEFELLKYLAQHAGRVYRRGQLLQVVWGRDFFGGSRTVDVHVRRLRAKLGADESLIGTVHGVGYTAVRPAPR